MKSLNDQTVLDNYMNDNSFTALKVNPVTMFRADDDMMYDEGHPGGRKSRNFIKKGQWVIVSSCGKIESVSDEDKRRNYLPLNASQESTVHANRLIEKANQYKLCDNFMCFLAEADRPFNFVDEFGETIKVSKGDYVNIDKICDSDAIDDSCGTPYHMVGHYKLIEVIPKERVITEFTKVS